eukprot:CAMPEP_0177758876 /NCGR_PEP_ID=MMETSP0491_2-20121128/4425_1 /TAXON_ID=63592 /ORGANISM="Tetraselmis chuii, Strain PLY429" /LENGTH=77 /DNA_ID=CAMNT_0019274653 /DNA_START=506 /DNA_END=736 /DNA_ORIENTATION=+
MVDPVAWQATVDVVVLSLEPRKPSEAGEEEATERRTVERLADIRSLHQLGAITGQQKSAAETSALLAAVSTTGSPTH